MDYYVLIWESPSTSTEWSYDKDPAYRIRCSSLDIARGLAREIATRCKCLLVVETEKSLMTIVW